MPPRQIELDQEPVWEIQFDETVTQYRAFCLYRDLLDGRTLAKVAERWEREERQDADGKKIPARKANGTTSGVMRRMQEWSRVNRWVERSDAYDLYLQHKILEARETEITRMARNEAQLGRALVSGAMRRLFGFEDGDDPTKNIDAIDWNKVTPGELAILARLGVDVSRLSTNRPTALIKAALMVTSTEFVQATSDLTEMLMRHIPDDRKPIAAEEVRAYSQGERRMLTQG